MGRRVKRNRRKRRIQIYLRVGGLILLLMLLVMGFSRVMQVGVFANRYVEIADEEIDAVRPDMEVNLLSINSYSRPGTSTEKIKGIVIHYTANPGSTAIQNRNYFEGLKDSHLTKASSHFIVGIEGEIIQCVPTWEVAYASNDRNSDTISIETCHKKEDGVYTKETYHSLVQLTAWLCEKFELTEQDVIRHYDVTGKNCPKYFVENEEAWETFKLDVKKALARN